MRPSYRGQTTRSLAPSRAGLIPHVLSLALASGCVLAACESGNAQEAPPTVLGMTNTMAPFYQDEELTLYEAQIPVPLPVRKPTAQDLMGLGSMAPYPRAPYLLDTDESVEIEYTISNLDNQEHNVELLLDPWNEFVRYRPGVTVVSDDETTPNLSGYDNIFPIPAMGRLTGTLTSDDTQEMAIDLATCMNILSAPVDPTDMDQATNESALCNRAFNIQNRSNDGDPLLTPLIPKVIAGLTGFDLGIRTMEPANVAVEISINIIDNNGNRILAPGFTASQRIAMPTTILSLPGAR